MSGAAIVPDIPLPQARPLPALGPGAATSSDTFGTLVDDLGSVFGKAERAEDSFASGTGNLQNAIYERARADVALSVATAAAQRLAQAVQSVTNMQV